MKLTFFPVFLLAGAMMAWPLGCDPENTKSYPCMEKDCQATCQAKGRPEGDDPSHPFGRCIQDECQCEAALADPWEWSTPQEPQDSNTDTETL